MRPETFEMENATNNKKITPEVYIEFLSRTIGVSREEILEVVKHSGINSRRIAEYLVKFNAAKKAIDNNPEQ